MKATNATELLMLEETHAAVRNARQTLDSHGQKVGFDRVMHVAHVIAAHADETGKAFPSVRRVASCTGLDHRVVSRAVKLLEESGILAKTSAQGRHTVYLFTGISPSTVGQSPDSDLPSTVGASPSTTVGGTVGGTVGATVGGSPDLREEKKKNYTAASSIAARSRGRQATCFFVDDGNGTCVGCGLPRENVRHGGEAA